jgi:hypothetical protein
MLVFAARRAGLVRLEFRVGAKRALAAVVGAAGPTCVDRAQAQAR